MYMIASYVRKNTPTQQIRFCPMYGVFERLVNCNKKVKELNKRSLRGNIYFAIPMDIH